MAPLSLKIVQDGGAVTRKVKLDPETLVRDAVAIVREKALQPADDKTFGLFLRSVETAQAGIWLEEGRRLAYYVLRDGDRLDYMSRLRNLRLRMLDGAVKTLQVDQSKLVGDLMLAICSKLAITNHEEYGLCFDPAESAEDKETKALQAGLGTLTSKKKSQLRTRDVQLEQLSKKLNTDDNVEWLDPHKTLSEASIDPARTLLLKRRLYYSDRKVDSRDPVQLNLLYVQARDNILASTHPVTEAKAAVFAGIQCQIQFGDYNEEKHKPGFLEDLREYLPEQYCGSWGMEKKVLREFSKHSGLTELEAKYLYTKTARELPTYGVTFFLVKEVQKGKKKLIHRLLGINSEAILRLDEVSKEIIQQWPLTHIKTYSAGKGNSFTLNFGDYTDQEYSVKTQDAFRIRDILESYIDLIRKRMLAAPGAAATLGYVIDDHVAAARASTMTVVANEPQKPLEHSFVGPSRIVEYQPGQKAESGTQLVTVQQIVASQMLQNQGQGMKSEIPRAEELNRSASCRLKRVNSKSVKVVTLLTDPSDNNIEEARKLVHEMNDEMPHVKEGVQKTADNQSSEENRRKLEEQMRELDELVATLEYATDPTHLNMEEAGDAARKIAETSTQMYLSLDPGSRRRSAIMKRQRDSFIADERTQDALRVGAHLAAGGRAERAAAHAGDILQQKYQGPDVEASRETHLKMSLRDKLGKLNAALAHHMLAHSDPSNVDYPSAVTSLHAIEELVMELAKDAQALSSVKDETCGKELLDSATELISAVRAACLLGNSSDLNQEKQQEAVNKYIEAGGKLMFILGPRSKLLEDKEKEIVELARSAELDTGALGQCARQAAQCAGAAAGAGALAKADARASAAAAALVTHARLAAPALWEPQCRSALAAAGEALAAALQRLAAAGVPGAGSPLNDDMQRRALGLARTLDKLKAAYADLDGIDQDAETPEASREGQRLKFIHTLGNFQKNYQLALHEANKTGVLEMSPAAVRDAEMRLADRLGQLNAAISSLFVAYAEKENPDYAAAESAISTINDLMPEIAKDGRLASGNKTEDSRLALMDQLRELFQAMDCLQADPDKFTNEGALKLAGESGKLVYIVGKRINPVREDKIMDLSMESCNQASALLANVQAIAEGMGGDKGAELDEKGAVLADAAERLIATAQITSPTISSPACRGRMLCDIQATSLAAQQLSQACEALKQDPAHEAQAKSVMGALDVLQDQLDKLKAALDIPDLETQEQAQIVQVPSKDQERLEFMMSLRGAQKELDLTDQGLHQATKPATVGQRVLLERRLTDRLAALDRAIRSLRAATQDPNPDYAAARRAMATITELMPLVVQDAHALSASEEGSNRDKMLSHVRDLCRETQQICSAADDPEEFKRAVQKCVDSSNKFVFILSKRNTPEKKDAMKQSLVTEVSNNAEVVMGEVGKLFAAMGGDKGEELKKKGAMLVQAIHDFIITAQSPQPAPKLEGATSVVLSTTASLRGVALSCDTKHTQLLDGLMALDSSVAVLHDVCSHEDQPLSEEEWKHQKLRYVKTKQQLDSKFADVNKQINEPGSQSGEAGTVRPDALCRLHKLNAALASLHNALTDRKKPDYETAQQSMMTIAELLPLVVQDIQTSSAGTDERTRAAMLADLKELCDAAQLMCSDDGSHPETYNHAVTKLTAASNNLTQVLNPDHDTHKQQQLIASLATDVCGRASHLESEVMRVAEEIGGMVGEELREEGETVGDAAREMKLTVQMLAPSISEPQSRAALQTAINRVTRATLPLRRDVATVRDVTQQCAIDKALQLLDSELAALREACDGPAPSAKTALPTKPSKPTVARRPGQALPNRNCHIDATAEFLNALRSEESQAGQVKPKVVEMVPPRSPAETLAREHFSKTAEDAARALKFHEEDLLQASKSPEASGRALSNAEMLQHQEMMQHHLALAGVEVASLVAAGYLDKIEYDRASQSIAKLSRQMSQVCDISKHLSDNMDEHARKVLLSDVAQLCAEARNICDDARTDRQKLNEAAVEFGDKSAKLWGAICTDGDPELENEIISRTKAIGNSASRLASETATLAAGVDGARKKTLCEAGAHCVDAAGKLVYTAKVTAATLQMPCSQQALVSSAEALDSSLQEFRTSWASVTEPRLSTAVADLNKEADTLGTLLHTLRDDVKDGNIIERREMERLVVEDTPLRQLTEKVIDGAKAYAYAESVPARMRHEYAAYADRLAGALRALDLANARYRKAPHDESKRRQFESALQNLQISVLQARPHRGQTGHSNIVDLRDFIEEVSSEAKAMTETANDADVTTAKDKLTLEGIRKKCAEIEGKAQQLMNFDDMWEIDQLGQECDDLIKQINADIKGVEDANARSKMLSKMLPLTESTNMLRFATKCSIAATEGASLDATFEELDDMEGRLIASLGNYHFKDDPNMGEKESGQRCRRAASRLCLALAGGQPLGRPLVAYIAAQYAARGQSARRPLYALCGQLRAACGLRARRAGSGLPPHCSLPRLLLAEIQKNSDSGVDVEDISKLLAPAAPKILGDDKEQESSIINLSEKLSSLSSALIGADQAATQGQFPAAASDLVAAADELDALARGCYADSPLKARQRDEAARQMKLDAYSVIVEAEAASKEPGNHNQSRRLAAARERLNASINRLVRAAAAPPPQRQRAAAVRRDVALRARGEARGVAPRAAPAPLPHLLRDLADLRDCFYNLKDESTLGLDHFLCQLDDLGSAVRKSTDLAENCAYYIGISDKHKELAQTGLVDVPHIHRCIEAVQDSCLTIIGASDVVQARDEAEALHSRVQELSWALEKAQAMGGGPRAGALAPAAGLLAAVRQARDVSTITARAVDLLQDMDAAHVAVERCPLLPSLSDMSPDNRERCDAVLGHSRDLLTHTLEMLSDVESSPQQQQETSWRQFPSRTKVVDSYDALVKTIKVNGHRAGILETSPEEEVEEVTKKSYLETQLVLANKWLKSPTPKAEVKAVGLQAVRNVVDLARDISEDLTGSEREDTRHLITETEELLGQCCKVYDEEKNSVLMDHIKELKKTVERCVVTRVVEDFLLQEPLLEGELDELAPEASQRQYILERKLASLLAQLARVGRTARLLQRAGAAPGLAHATEQTELLAPMLVKAAQQRIDHPDDQEAIEQYKSLLAQYAESMARVRECCDRAVDPMDFVQAAGDTMQRLREDMSHNSDPQACHYTSTAINRLARRVVSVGLWSAGAAEPALAAALRAARARLACATAPAPGRRASQPPDWRDTADQVMRVTGEVESALGGENIFNQQPTVTIQPIHSVARSLHESVRGWSARDNELVSVARRLAVLLARLAQYMRADNTQALIATSKSIVTESQEVAELAKKLAHECTDVRIKNNLLQLVQRIPTISGQLKMLITVKGSFLGQQGNFEDKEAMDMLVVNAQGLMSSIQEVVKAAAAASVKIMSQRGPRLKWVRNNYY